MAYLAKCVGLVTFRNELNNLEGALAVADNVNIDQPDVLSSRRGFADFGSSFGNLDTRLKQVFEYKNVVLRHFEQTLQYQIGNNFASFSGSFSELEEGIRIKGQEANRNFYFTTSEGIKKIGARNAEDLPNTVVRDAGAVKAVDLSGTPDFAINGFLPPQSKVAYRILFGYTDRNNNLILGSPSSRFILTNNSRNINVNEEGIITFTGAPDASDYVLLTTDVQRYTIWFDTTGSDTAPQEADTINTVFIKVDLSASTTNSQRANVTANTLFQSVDEVTVTVDTDTVTIENTEAGDVANIAAGTNLTNVTVATTVEGSIIQGQFANVNLEFTLPSGLDNRYFYQVYRTAVFPASQDIALVDIDPGDDMNLVLEEPITNADIANGSIIIEESTPESFRQSGVPLYTSPNIGQGILRANERPPVAKDIALFRNSLFFANTSVAHSLQFNLVSVLNITSGTSAITIGNSDVTNTYTFVGTKEKSKITVDTTSNTTPSSWILFNSASNKEKYYLFLDTTGSDTLPNIATYPELAGRQLVRVNLSLYPDTLAGSQQAVFEALSILDDFDAEEVSTNQVDFENTNNGKTDDIALGDVAPGGAWDVDVVNQGDGEDVANKQFLLSGELSPAIAIDETARSIVRVINKDPDSTVNALYLSGPDDLPGIIRLEAKNQEDNPFLIGANSSTLSGLFTPRLPTIEDVESITFSASGNSPANIQDTDHGLVTGDRVYIEALNTTPVIRGSFEVTVVDANNFTIPFNITIEDDPSDAFYFRIDELASDNLTSPNRLYYSKLNQPESVPIVNFIEIGPKDEPIERILALRDSLIVMKTDGIYTISGTSEPNFIARLVDSTATIIAPDSAVILNNQIFALTTQGVCSITESGVGVISRVIEDKIRSVTKPIFNTRTIAFGVAYENDRSYLLWLPTRSEDVVGTQCYRYNTFDRSWTRWTKSATCGIVNFIPDKLYIGDGDRNFLMEERKNGDRTDFADRDFMLSIPTNAKETEKRYRLSTVAELEVGDVLTQEQLLTINIYNRLLRKLDVDVGLDNDYEATLKMFSGDSITVKMQQLNDKLVADDESGIITAFTASTVQSTLLSQYNNQISQLNNVDSDASFSNYKQESGETYVYEALIVNIERSKNEVEFQFEVPFYEGNIRAYKAIKSLVEWNPQHFGDPSMLKQISEATIIFDQNNFFGATLSFSSDLSQNYVDIPFRAAGSGYWGYSDTYVESKFYFGGNGNDAPFRTFIPRDKQRCRYLNIRFTHINARDGFNITGVSAKVRPISTRAYR